MSKKLLFIFGTRPEAIKMIPVIKEFQKYNTIFNTKVCVTAQHREMLDSVMNFFHIDADYDLNVMKKDQSLSELTANILVRLDHVLQESQPDFVFVHGDTTTTFTASLASYYRQIAVVHIEAGLRTNDIYSPFPEEINRQLVSKIAKYHFAPTQNAKQVLVNEGIKEENVFVVGNSVIDSLFLSLNEIQNNETMKMKIGTKLLQDGINLNDDKKIVLITGHRRENFGDGFLRICESIRELAQIYKDVDFIYPVHLNPSVQQPVKKILSGLENVYLIDPLDYQEFIFLMSKSYLILTDSGGIQEEAPSFGKPVLVMRDNTERPEAIQSGVARLVGTDKIVENVTLLLESKFEYEQMAKSLNPYGDGSTSKQILKMMENVS